MAVVQHLYRMPVGSLGVIPRRAYKAQQAKASENPSGQANFMPIHALSMRVLLFGTYVFYHVTSPGASRCEDLQDTTDNSLHGTELSYLFLSMKMI
jgi:hypothetical protein